MGVNIIDVNLQFKSALQNRNRTDYLVLHHAEASSATVQQIHQWHLNNGWAGIGYHYYVRKDGSIYRGRPRNAIGAHCQGHNSDSIGICAEGNYMSEVMPEAQKQSIIELCKELLTIYPNAKIVGHRDLYATACPGTNYPFNGITTAILNPMVPGLPFTDVYGHWALTDIQAMYNRHLISAGTTFRPNDSMTRAEAIVILDRVIHYIKGNITLPNTSLPPLKEAIPDWAYNNIMEVYKLGLLSSEIRPNDPITRAEFCVLLKRLLEFLGIKLSPVAIPFTDMIGHWAFNDVSKLYSIGLLSNNTKFRPNDSITRAEATALFNRVLKYLGK